MHQRIGSLFSRKRPEVSLVIPVYNVESYLAECLDSVLAQTVTDFEVIAIDDGSTDGTPQLLREYARRDRRIRVFRQENAGPGAALNAGVRRARGTYLTFAGSDDLLPPTAFASHLTALRATGSDFTVGAIKRLRAGRLAPSRWVAQTNAVDDLAVTIDERPDMIVHAIPCSKMFRTDFWRDNGLEFSEGVLYEDQIPSVQAFLHAATFDVLADLVYIWRWRDSGDSITQSTASMRNISDTIWVSSRVNAILLADARPGLRRRWLDERILNHSTRLFADDIDYVEPDYYAKVVEWLKDLFTDADWEELSQAPVLWRLLAWTLVHGSREQVAQIRMHERVDGPSLPTEVRGTRVYAVPTFDVLHARDVPAHLLCLGEKQTAVSAAIRRITWDNPRQLTITGWAFIGNFDIADDGTEIAILCVNERTGETRRVPTSARTDLEVGRWSPGNHAQVDRSGFDATIDLNEFYRLAAAQSGHNLIDTWRLSVRVSTHGIVREGRLSRPSAEGGAKTPFPGPLVDGVIIKPHWGTDGFVLEVLRPTTVCESVVESGPLVTLAGRAPANSSGRILLDEQTVGSFEADELGSFAVTFPVAAIAEEPDVARKVRIDLGSGPKPLLCAGSIADSLPSRKSFVARATARGRLVFGAPAAVIHVRQLELTDNVLAIDGTASGVELHGLMLECGRIQLPAGRLEVSADGAFAASFVLARAEWGSPVLPIPTGEYCLTGTGYATDGQLLDVDTRVDDAVFSRMPMDSVGLLGSDHAFSPYRLHVTAKRVLTLEAVAQLTDAESPAGRMRVRQQVYLPAVASRSTKHAVLFESHGGDQATGDPAAIWRELARRNTDLAAFWTVADLSVAVPAGTTPLVRQSRQWFELLATAKYLVNNDCFPPCFTKSPAQIQLQTGPGTPLERIGHDAPGNDSSSRVRLATMDREAARWDHLIAANAFASAVLPPALGYGGKVLETGSPRNDVLSNDRQGAADRARRNLGLAANRKVLLYAPAGRDSQGAGKFTSVNQLDSALFAEAFGDEYVVVVHGPHHTAPDGEPVSGNGVIDVTGYPEVADLYAVADVLITDYSSAMFDYAITGRPIIYLVPDLADRRDGARGFYVDLETQAPGPLVGSTADVIDAMADLGRMTSTYSDRYAKFRATFTGWDDGGASARVVDDVFGRRGDA